MKMEATRVFLVVKLYVLFVIIINGHASLKSYECHFTVLEIAKAFLSIPNEMSEARVRTTFEWLRYAS